jgi:hypothetical protein
VGTVSATISRACAKRLGFGSNELPWPAILLMDHGIEAVDHKFDRCRRPRTFPTRIVDACRKARQVRCRLWRETMHAPAAAQVIADLQAQGHSGHRSVQHAICQDENVSQRHDAESDQHQDQHCFADLERNLASALLSVGANRAVWQALRVR